jgi:predicted xylose isomerase-like sugar epimerase
MPWIITFGPLSDEEDWEPVVCGPYERPHALALAEEIVADEELMAVVEPLLSFTSVDEIRSEIVAAKAMAAATGDNVIGELDQELDEELDEELEFDEELDGSELDIHEETVMPSADEVRAGMARIAHRLAEPS